MVWLANGHSVRGTGHFASGLPCQDSAACNLRVGDNVLIACVADGGGTPEKFASFIRSEGIKWAKVIKDANVKMDA